MSVELQTSKENPFLQVLPSKEAWLLERRRGIGASELAAAAGIDPFKSRYTLWCEKSGLIPEAPGDADDISEAAVWGAKLEPAIAEHFAEITKRPMVDHGRHTIWWSKCSSCGGEGGRVNLGEAWIRCKECLGNKTGFLFATLDRELPAITGDDGPGILEVKAPGFLQRDRWIDGPPHHILVQVHAQLLVTGFRWGIVAALFGGQDFRTYRVERDDELLAMLLDAGEGFMHLVRGNIEPIPDGSASTREALKKLYPEDTGAEVDLVVELTEVADAYDRANASLAECRKTEQYLKQIRDEAENKLRAAIGSATFGKVGDRTYSLKTTKRQGYTVEPTKYRVLKLTTTKKNGKG